MSLRKREDPETEIGNTVSHCVENLLWNSLWTCRMTDHLMNKWI